MRSCGFMYHLSDPNWATRANSRKKGHGCDFSGKGQENNEKGQNIRKFERNVQNLKIF